MSTAIKEKRSKAAPEGLSPEQVKQLADLELRLTTGMEGFVQAAHAAYLISIRPSKGKPLFHPYDSYTDYMRTVHSIDKTQASRLKFAGHVMDEIDEHNRKHPEDVLVMPVNEGQCRAIAKLDNARWIEVWQLVQKSGQKISAQLISEVANKNSISQRKPARKSKPYPKEQLTVTLVAAKSSNTLRKKLGNPQKSGDQFLYGKTKGVRDMVGVLRWFATWLSQRGEELGIISLTLTIAEQPKPAPSPK